MGPIYMFHGLSVDCIDKHQPNSDARRKAYNCDITFGTNNEFGFDYLRDNMVISSDELVQRKHQYAIVDEVDSVLIDDARTPLIISGPMAQSEDDAQFMEFRPHVEKLYNAQRTLVNQVLNEAKKLIAAGDEAEGGKMLLRAYKGLPKYQPLIKYLSEPGIKVILQKSENYYMQDNEREMPVVTDPLYFVINEVLNTVDMTDKGHEVLASSVNDDSFFILPDVGSKIAEIENLKSDIDAKSKALDAASGDIKQLETKNADAEKALAESQAALAAETERYRAQVGAAMAPAAELQTTKSFREQLAALPSKDRAAFYQAHKAEIDNNK